mmetsp:Transcript_60190/g.135459  ORF Transcript_60190/g.135459 Transcript_60190/m.135459 type:complete len:116 (-) Transcript_60190:351-698(-)
MATSSQRPDTAKLRASASLLQIGVTQATAARLDAPLERPVRRLTPDAMEPTLALLTDFTPVDVKEAAVEVGRLLAKDGTEELFVAGHRYLALTFIFVPPPSMDLKPLSSRTLNLT